MNNELKEVLSLKGGKYSPNLSKFSRKKNNISKVYWIKWDSINGLNSEKGTFYFGNEYDGDFFSGVSVNSVRCGKMQIFAHTSFSKTAFSDIEHNDVTEWFIKTYKATGWCMFGDDWHHDFININKNSRKCRLCGKIEYRTIKSKKINKRIEVWK